MRASNNFYLTFSFPLHILIFFFPSLSRNLLSSSPSRVLRAFLMTESHEKYFKYRITNVILISNFFRVGKNVTVKNNQGSREGYGCYLGKRPTSAASTGRGTSFQRGDGSLGKTFARQGQSRIFIKRPCVWYITHDNPAGGRGV